MQAAPCDDLEDVVLTGNPTPITHTAHLKLDVDIVDTVDALEAFMVKFDRARELTARLGLTVEQIDELACEIVTLLAAHASLHDRNHTIQRNLVALLKAGLDTESVGRLVGLTRCDVIRRISCRSYTPDEFAARFMAEDMAEAGSPKGDIARATGMKYHSVVNYLKLIGLFKVESAGGDHAPHPSHERALQLMSEGLDNGQIRSALTAEGIDLPSRNCIANWRRRYHTEDAA